MNIINKRISLKITLTLVVCLAVIFALQSYFLLENRQQAIEQQLFAKGRMVALVGAATFSHLLTELVAGEHFSEIDIFDENYQLITEGPLAGAEIPKYHTRFDQYFDAHIQPLEDAFLADKMVVYAVLVDRNGYLPTHNSVYAKPLVGDAQQDRAGNRTKRIFNDPVGLAAARFQGTSQEQVLKQVYPRDTGVLMWDLTAPVFVHGQHWGGFRIGLSMEQVEASILDLRNSIAISLFVSLLGCSLLIMLAVTKYTRPLQSLTAAVQALASGRRKEKIELQSSDEIGLLVAAFNQMSETLEQTTVSRDYFDRLVQSMHDLLIVSDPDGKIVSVNRATCDVLGFSTEHLLTHKIQDLIKTRNGHPDWFTAQQSSLENHVADVFLVNCREEKFPMAMSSSPLLDSDRRLSGFILLLQENSARIEAEQAKDAAFDQAFKLNAELHEVNATIKAKNLELDEAYKLLKSSQVQMLHQEKMASIGQLAAGVAHEINNPMGFIGSNLGSLGRYLEKFQQYIQFQEQLLQQQPDAEAKQLLASERKKLKIDYLLSDSQDLISESLDGAQRVQEIVRNLKSFSRVDQMGEQLANLNECLESTIAIAWNELKYKVTLEKDYAPLPDLSCRPQQLNQVFMNLLVNGAQAIADKGIITIKTWHDERAIFVSISDSGCGIPPENLLRIFEPFFTTKGVGKGTGLGMSISYDIVKAHAGEIMVASTPGEGSTFTVRLPRKPAVKPSTETQS